MVLGGVAEAMKIYLCLDWTSMRADGPYPLLGISQFPILVSAASLWQKGQGRRFWMPRLAPHREFLLDSGAFSLLSTMPDYPYSVHDYVEVARKLEATHIAARDWPCEPFGRIRVPVEERIRRTVDADAEILDYPDLNGCAPLPVIQGWTPEQYVACIDAMKERGLIRDFMAVGSCCKRTSTAEVMAVARAVRTELPARVQLHFFGLKVTAFRQPGFARIAHSVDTGAWAFLDHYAPWVKGLCSTCGTPKVNDSGRRDGHLHMRPRAEERTHRLYTWLRKAKMTPQRDIGGFT